MSHLRLIVGLGNPGKAYADTRHNVGAGWVRRLASRYGIELKLDTKFKGEIGRGLIDGADVRLLIPATYMNNSGESVGLLVSFYKIPLEEVLVAYDELAFDIGVVKLKQGGGDAGHNGIKSVRAGCGNRGEFVRLRIGVGHPGDKSLVTGYLTRQTMPSAERAAVEAATDLDDALMADVVHLRWQDAMNVLHAVDSPGPDEET